MKDYLYIDSPITLLIGLRFASSRKVHKLRVNEFSEKEMRYLRMQIYQIVGPWFDRCPLSPATVIEPADNDFYLFIIPFFHLLPYSFFSLVYRFTVSQSLLASQKCAHLTRASASTSFYPLRLSFSISPFINFCLSFYAHSIYSLQRKRLRVNQCALVKTRAL